MGKITVSYERESRLPEWATPEAILALYESGKSLRDMEPILGVSRTTIGKIISRVKAEKIA